MTIKELAKWARFNDITDLETIIEKAHAAGVDDAADLVSVWRRSRGGYTTMADTIRKLSKVDR